MAEVSGATDPAATIDRGVHSKVKDRAAGRGIDGASRGQASARQRYGDATGVGAALDQVPGQSGLVVTRQLGLVSRMRSRAMFLPIVPLELISDAEQGLHDQNEDRGTDDTAGDPRRANTIPIVWVFIASSELSQFEGRGWMHREQARLHASERGDQDDEHPDLASGEDDTGGHDDGRQPTNG